MQKTNTSDEQVSRTRCGPEDGPAVRSLTMHTIARPITNGFGTVLAAEHDLLDTLHGLLAAENGRRDQGIARILAHQIGQLGVIIALLEQRDKLLPHPARFGALDHCIALLTHASNALSYGTEQSFANLVRRNQNLRRSLEVLIGQSGHHDGNETGLREAAQRHGEMEWVLTVLINEDDTRSQGAAIESGKAEGAWENEGGQRSGTGDPHRGQCTAAG